MADEQTRKFELPWGTLLPVLAALGGVISQFKPLVSTRPAVPSEKAVAVTAEQDVDARLWQDPIAVAQKQLEAEMKAGRGSEPNSARHDISALAGLLSERAKFFNDKKKVLLLAVMLEAGPYSEQGESRLRSRRAVLEGLSESGFLPIDSEHIGFVTTSWPPLEKAVGSPLPVDRALLLPWEECEPITDPKGPQDIQNTKRIVVVWLPAANFNPNPLRRFAALLDRLAGEIRDKIDVKLIGPANSTGLQNMVREVQIWDPYTRSSLSEQTQKTLDGVSIISPRATASDQTLLYRKSSFSIEKSVEELLEKSITKPSRGGLKFVRTIATDDRVLRKVIEELELRRIHVKKRTGENHPWESGNHIVILTEWDTPYGRSLNTTFAAEAFDQSVNEVIERLPYSEKTFSGDREKRFSDLGRRVHSYRYLRGIDGRLPGDSGKDNSREQGQKNQSEKNAVAVEATEGLNQSDYLRRLARELKEADARWQQEDNQGICAIGLLGSDIYDKLMILRALRPEFPSAVFFTNNYDAHFERRDDWDDTHNLIIASPFGASLPSLYSQQHVAPFRDSDQTSMYVGTLIATGRMDENVARGFLIWQPRIFEISRRGAQDLSPPWYLSGEVLADSNKAWFRDWFFSGTVPWRVAGAALAVVAIAAWIGVTIASRTLKGGGGTPQRLRRVLASTVFWLACGGPIIVLGVAAFAQYGSAADEPLAFFSGISVWPTEMLRLIVIMLVLHFLIKAGIDLRSNERKLTDLYCFDPLPLARFRWADLGVGLEQWHTSRAKTPRPKAKFSAEEAWHFYLRRNRFWARFIRIAILVTLYAVFSFCLLSLFPPSIPPARGEMAFNFDAVILFLSAISSMILSFYVVDAIGLNSNFIRMFAREVTKWGRGVVRASHRNPPLSDEELSAYHEIFFVAERTQVVARLIWYPLVALSLLFVARCSFFDNWTWPISLVVIFVLNAAWPIGSAILLRRAAEQLREAALSNLQLSRIKGRAIEGKREMFDELIAEIRTLKKGAFAPLTEQPFVRAIIVPSGGLGLLAIAQRFLGSF